VDGHAVAHPPAAGLSYADAGGVKVNDGRVKRSALYHLINTIMPINHVLKAKFDVWGSIFVVGLTLGTVSLMRVLLAWAQ